MADGSQAQDGYAALRQYDDNGDGVISAQDSVWSQLRVWVDSGASGTLGTTDAGELRSLDSLGIQSLNLTEDRTPGKDNGNLVGITSSYTTVDGQTRTMADVWFVADRDEGAERMATALETSLAAPEGVVETAGGTASAVPAVPAAPAASATPAAALELDIPASPATGAYAESAAPATVEPRKAESRGNPLATSEMRNRVSSLAAAIGEHATDGDDTRQADALFKRGKGLSVGIPGSQLASAPAPSFTAMVDVMSRFDAQGNSLMAKPQSAAPVALNTGLDKPQDWLSQGMGGAFTKN
jgi:hypothetical protein